MSRNPFRDLGFSTREAAALHIRSQLAATKQDKNPYNETLDDLIRRAKAGDTEASREVLQLAVIFLITKDSNDQPANRDPATEILLPVPPALRDYLAEALHKIAWGIEPADKALGLSKKGQTSTAKHHHKQLVAEQMTRLVQKGYDVKKSGNMVAAFIAELDKKNVSGAWQGLAGQQWKGATMVKWFYEIHPPSNKTQRLRKRPVNRKLTDK